MEETSRFHWADYVVFAASLVLSASVGIYFGFAGKRQKSTEDFLMAGRKMSIIPVSLSLFVSWMSAISVLGDPTEAYQVGAMYWILGFGHALGIPVVAHVFAPYFHKMNIVSAYELLETKYSRFLRLFSTSANIGVLWLWLGIVLYAPALALSQSSGMPVWVAMVSITVVCIFYTSLGGMKAVLWTDALQMGIMLAGQLAIVIQGCIKVGGLESLFNILEKTGHDKFKNFTPDPMARASFWTFLIGGIFRTINPYIGNQMLIQRYCTLPTAKKATIAVYLTIPVYIGMCTLFTATGLVAVAVYSGCDPLKSGRINKMDQLIPLLVLDLLGFAPGIPGLFMACVFSASLSSLSSGINSMSANTLKDFIEPVYEHHKKKKLDDRIGTIIAKALVVVYGALILGMGFIMQSTGGNIFALTAKVIGMVGSPVAGIFCVMVFFPFVKNKSVTFGCLITLALCLWWGCGAFSVPTRATGDLLPLTADRCNGTNATFFLSNYSDFTTVTTAINSTFVTTEAPAASGGFHLHDLYFMNPLIFNPLGCLGTVFLALIFHGFGVAWDSCFKKDEEYSLDEKPNMEMNGKVESNGVPHPDQHKAAINSTAAVNEGYESDVHKI